MLKFSKIVVLFIMIVGLIGCNKQEVVTLTMPDGSVYYQGEINDEGKPNGKGTWITGDVKLEGNFVNGEPHGYAIHYWDLEEKEVIFDGEWNMGDPIYLEPQKGMTKYDIQSKTALGLCYELITEKIDNKEYNLCNYSDFDLIVVYDKNDKVIEIRNK